MSATVRKVLQYVISLAIATALLLYLFQDFNFQLITEAFKKADYRWVVLSAVLTFTSHLMRAHRWNIILKPLGYAPSLYTSFLAVMSGYFINLVVPRGGEVARSGLLQKMERIPATKAFGTIVLERIIDVLILGTLIVMLLAVEVDQITQIITSTFSSKLSGLQSKFYLIVIAGVGLLLLTVLVFFRFKQKIQQSLLYAKGMDIVKKVLEGVVSILKVKNQGAFWFHTIGIWAMYYLMAFVLFQCFPITSDLSPWVGFTVLVVGGIGMAAPVQGGIGAYHILITPVLMYYLASKHPQKDEVLSIVTFMHAAQTLVTIMIGGIALWLSTAMTKRQNAQALPEEDMTEEKIKAV
ncbi:lysylphosphatidylglycerol synthase transmembrane domain-containing protein [uncultured Microscilla sp.]|uniref:lysylphosphatidylglycerol synthase transmembrane domain-containing protein n=1 Tax=uncultured Microscilla sp. TaxID=432653 RepID=UPI002630D2C9|nr:lysylphosphatidylglycerol synthase transmembrane domain-containing protein [uncultured Microscilla sp.]